jgi:hypothetical protein
VMPVITATSSKGFKQQVTDYRSPKVTLTPFNKDESVTLIKALAPYLSEEWFEAPRFLRLILSCGGLPRCLADCLVPGLDHYSDKLSKTAFDEAIFQLVLPLFFE